MSLVGCKGRCQVSCQGEGTQFSCLGTCAVKSNASWVMVTWRPLPPRTDIPLADLRGCSDTPLSLGVQILSISCSFQENLAKSCVGAPTSGSWRPWGNPGSATANSFENTTFPQLRWRTVKIRANSSCEPINCILLQAAIL